jgi:hypothetical protein
MSRATLWLQYRLIIQFFMVAALVATNVFNVFTMNLGTTGLPLGQVCAAGGSRFARAQHMSLNRAVRPCCMLRPACRRSERDQLDGL